MWPFASCSPERASSLEEGLAAAENYDGDPLECPCIQHMKEGPCGDKFVIAYKCFLDSKEEEKGSDCLEPFRAMQQCFAENPEHYKEFLGDEDEEATAEELKRAEAIEWQIVQVQAARDKEEESKKKISM